MSSPVGIMWCSVHGLTHAQVCAKAAGCCKGGTLSERFPFLGWAPVSVEVLSVMRHSFERLATAGQTDIGAGRVV